MRTLISEYYKYILETWYSLSKWSDKQPMKCRNTEQKKLDISQGVLESMTLE